MTNTAMCRVCLAVDVRMHALINTPLQEIYEKITNIPVSSECKPAVACYICFAHLKGSYTLMTRAQKADSLLTEILRSGDEPKQSKHQTCLTNFHTSQIQHVSTIEVEENQVEVKKEEIKRETESKEKLEDVYADSDHQSIRDPSHSDSEDDVPLKNISTKSRTEKKRVRVRKREWVQKRDRKGFSADFAKEIILSKEDQLKELKERAKSLNYLNSPLKCEFCFKGFVDARAYENHMSKHDEKSGAHTCDICLMRYATVRQLRTHAATAHSRRYACRQCAHRAHTANQAREHEKWHSGYTYECKLCGQPFRKPTSYLTHMRKRHPTQHVCDMCGDSFVGRHGLLMHKSKTHRGEQQPDNPSEPESDRFCRECNMQFHTVDAWKRHILTAVRHTLANESSVVCGICGWGFPTSSRLSLHLKEHDKELRAARSKPVAAKAVAELACDQCDSHFVNRSKLQAHIKRIHLGLKYNKNIVCEVCGKKCTSNASLKYHQRTHTGEKPFPCVACGKRFADTNQLRIHTRTHTGERPYCCAVCGKRFSQKPALNRHYRVHTGAKPYICQFCSKTFSQSNSLKLHVRTVHLKMPPNRKSKQTPEAEAVVEKTEEPTLHSL